MFIKEEKSRGFGEPVMVEDPDGYYHLPGRQELALDVQAEVLPGYGFEGNRKGLHLNKNTLLSMCLVDPNFLFICSTYKKAMAQFNSPPIPFPATCLTTFKNSIPSHTPPTTIS